ncbi:pertactin-like passenger domain-containing protein [Ostreibacterium oceani]|uniref:Autotransporter outer membrane beta-barrel domain-containing protein n=1 Tax=Ostreibacterium oceani TaxID=2654998 RepID=A0A6N7ETS7_9GAMM|nr:pertactin-like passenger domain-containing protein [Ostreibacterium oceani]MPV85353.1 autotransporter outer membrane beta-barrel domain-containing protein [Ostreibacterium oceani]
MNKKWGLSVVMTTLALGALTVAKAQTVACASVGTLAGDKCTLNGANIAGVNINSLTDNAVDSIVVTESGAGVRIQAAPLDITITDAIHLELITSTLGATGLDLQGGDDTLTNNESGTGRELTISGNMTGGDGNDTADVVGINVNGDVFGNAGDDTLTFTQSMGPPVRRSVVTGNIDGGDDNDTLSVSFTDVTGDLIGGLGDDSLTVSGDATVVGLIDGGDGNDAMTVGDSASVDDINAGAGDDTVLVNSTFSGPLTTHVALNAPIDGGDGVDTFTFENWEGTPPDLLNWETLNLTASIVTLGLTTAVTDLVDIDPDSILEIGTTLGMTTALLTNAGELRLFDQAVVTVSNELANSNRVTLVDGATDDTPTVTGNFNNTGTVALDINTADHSADLLTITGDNTAQLTLALSNLDPANSDNTNIPLVTVNGAPGTAVLEGGGTTLTAGGVTYELQLLTDTWTLVPLAGGAGGAVSIPSTGLTSLVLALSGLAGIAFTVMRRESKRREITTHA